MLDLSRLPPGFYAGSLQEDRNARQWIVGPFRTDLPPEHPLRRDDVEIKYAMLSAGAERKREHASKTNEGITIEIILSGSHTMCFNVDDQELEFTLEAEGGNNYLIYPPGCLHWWRARTNAVVLTIHLLKP